MYPFAIELCMIHRRNLSIEIGYIVCSKCYNSIKNLRDRVLAVKNDNKWTVLGYYKFLKGLVGKGQEETTLPPLLQIHLHIVNHLQYTNEFEEEGEVLSLLGPFFAYIVNHC